MKQQNQGQQMYQCPHQTDCPYPHNGHPRPQIFHPWQLHNDRPNSLPTKYTENKKICQQDNGLIESKK